MGKIFEFTAKLLTERKHSKIWHRISTLIACLVVFTTTYSMILPALTFDEVTASEEPGFVMGAAENEQEAVPVEDVSQNEYYEEEPIQNDSNYTEDYTASTGSADSGELIVEEEPAAVPAADTTNVYDNTVRTEEAGFAPEGDGEVVDFSDTEEAETVLTYEDAEVRLTASFEDPTYEIPAGLTLKVAPIAYGSEQYNALNDGANERLTEIGNYVISYSTYYDIWFELNNETVIPALNVKLEAQYKNRDLGETGVKLFSYNYDGNAITLHDDVTWGVYDDTDPTWPWRSSFTFRTHGGDIAGHTIAGLLNTEVVEKETADDEAEVSEEEAAVPEENAEPETTIEETATEDTVSEETQPAEEAVIGSEEFLEEGDFEVADEDIVPAEETEEDELTEAEAVGDAAADDEAAAEETSEEEDSEEASLYKAGQIVYNGSDYTVELNVPEETHIPADAELKVDEIDPESDAYKEYYDQAMAAINEEGRELEAGFARFFDIRFEKAGVEIEPNPLARIDVKINFTQTVDQQNEAENVQTGEVSAVHFAENAVQEIEVEAETQGEAADVAEITFEASSFSVFGFIYTVDFETVDGGKFSVPGKGSFKLNDLLPFIINKEGLVTDATLELIEGEDIAGALYLTQDENDDWYINSNVAFTSTYLLSMMVEGVKYEVKVTDATQIGYTSLVDLTDGTGDVLTVNAIGSSGNVVDGNTLATHSELSVDIVFEIRDENNVNDFNTLLENARPSGTVKLDYDLSDLINDHPTLSGIEGNGTLRINGNAVGTYAVADGHVLLNINAEAIKSDKVEAVEGSINIRLEIDKSEATTEGQETYDFPGTGTDLTINWPGTAHGTGTKSVTPSTTDINTGENDGYLYYDYTVEIAGGVGLENLKMNDYLPEGMEIDGDVTVTRNFTTYTQTSTRSYTRSEGQPPHTYSFGAWTPWVNSSSEADTASETVNTLNGSTGTVNLNVLSTLGLTEADSVTPQSEYTYSDYVSVSHSGDPNYATTRTRELTESTYVVTYRGRILKSTALSQIPAGATVTQLKNNVMWNEDSTPIDGGDATVTINKKEPNPGTKAVDGVYGNNIQVAYTDMVVEGDKRYAKVSYTITISEPFDVTTAVLTDTLSQYQKLYGTTGTLLAGDEIVSTPTLSPTGVIDGKGGTISFNLTDELTANGKTFTPNTTYTLKYDTLVAEEDFGRDIQNNTDWTINNKPVPGEDRTVIVEKLPYEQGTKRDNLTDNHVSDKELQEGVTIPWEIRTYQHQNATDVVLSDTFSDDQEVVEGSFKIIIAGTSYTVPADASYLHVNNSSHSFTIDFDEAIKALTGATTDPAFKAETEYKVTYETKTHKYDKPDTPEVEQSHNESTWTFDGTSDEPAPDDVVLYRDDYVAPSKVVKSSEGTGTGNFTVKETAQVESININDNQLDLSYRLIINEPLKLTRAQLVDTYSNYETVDFDNMTITVGGRAYPVPRNLITTGDHTFTVDIIAVLTENRLPFTPDTNYFLDYNTYIPLTDNIKNLLKAENDNGDPLGLTVTNQQKWNFDGDNGPKPDVPGNNTEYTFEEKPYNGGDKSVAAYDGTTGELMDVTRNDGGTVVTLVDQENNTLKYTITLTEHRNANKVVLKDNYTNNQVLDTNSFTVTFTDSTGTHTIPVTTSNGLTLGSNSFELNLTDVLASANPPYEFTPEVTYTINYEATTSAVGQGVPGPQIKNNATWDFDDGNEEEGGEPDIHLEIPDYIPGEKVVSVRESIKEITNQTGSDWSGAPYNDTTHTNTNVGFAATASKPYHLDYKLTIFEERPITTAVVTDTFSGSADQKLDTGSFNLQIENGELIPISANYITATDPTKGFSFNLSAFLAAQDPALSFEKNTHYYITFTTETTTYNNTAANGDGADNKADWRLNDVTLDGGHTETHINKVTDFDKVFYNEDGTVQNPEVDFGQTVQYRINIGDENTVLNGYWFTDYMMLYHHLDKSRGVDVYRNYGTDDEELIAEDIMNHPPTGWSCQGNDPGDNWNSSEYYALYVQLPGAGAPEIKGPITVVYYATVGTLDQTRITGTQTVTNRVYNDDGEITTHFDLHAGGAEVEKHACAIEEDSLDQRYVTAWWTVDVTPLGGMSLKGLKLEDFDARFSTNSAADAASGTNTFDMSVVNDSYEVTYAGGDHEGEPVPTNYYRRDNNNLHFTGDIYDPIIVRFATRSGYLQTPYNGGNIYMTNSTKLTDSNGSQVGEPSTATKQLEEEGTVTATKSVEESKLDTENGKVWWIIDVQADRTATLYNTIVGESMPKYSTVSLEDAKGDYSGSWMTYDLSTAIVRDAESGNVLVAGTDYVVENINYANNTSGKGIWFKSRIKHATIELSTDLTIPSGLTYVYNKAIVQDRDGNITYPDDDTTIENYDLHVDKTHGETVPTAPNFDQEVDYTVKVNEARAYIPEGKLTFVDVLPPGMEYVEDSYSIVFDAPNYTDIKKITSDSYQEAYRTAWGILKPETTTRTLEDGRVQQTLTIDFSKYTAETLTLDHWMMTVNYKAKLSASEINRLKNLGTNVPQIYLNDATVSQGDKATDHDTSDWEYSWNNGLDKVDITDATFGRNTHNPILYYAVVINPEGREMNKGNELVLTDRIETSMELNLSSVKVYEYGGEYETVDTSYGPKETPKLGREVTNTQGIKVSYDGITRNLTVRCPDRTPLVVTFDTTIENPTVNVPKTFENTAFLTGESVWEDKAEEEHTVVTTSGTISYEVGDGFVIEKVDGNAPSEHLKGAEFTLYKMAFPAMNNLQTILAQYENYDTDKAAGNIGDYDLSPFVLSGQDMDFVPQVKETAADGIVMYKKLQLNTLYYWVETKPPVDTDTGEHYSAGLFSEPQYLILFTDDDNIWNGKSEQYAKLLDHLIEDANGIKVNNALKGFAWYATNVKEKSYKATKIWQDNNDAAGKRPEFIYVQLKQDGANYDDPATAGNEGLVRIVPNSVGSWEYTWYDLPATKNGGVDYEYTAVELTPAQMLQAGLITAEQKTALEEQLADYTTLYEDVAGGIEITNRIKDETTLLINKAWDDDDNISKLRPGFIEVALYRETLTSDNESEIGDIVRLKPTDDKYNVWEIDSTDSYCIRIYANDGWKAEFSGLVKEDGNKTYRYFIVEEPITGYEATYSNHFNPVLSGGSAGGTTAGIADSEGIITITNKLDVFKATKKWLDVDGKETWSGNVRFKLVKILENGDFDDNIETPEYYQINELPWSQTIVTSTGVRYAIWEHLDHLPEGQSYFAVEDGIILPAGTELTGETWLAGTGGEKVVRENGTLSEDTELFITRNEQGAAVSFKLNGLAYDVTGGQSTSGTGTIVNAPRVNEEFTKTWSNVADTSVLELKVRLRRINKATGQYDTEFNEDATKYPQGQPVVLKIDNKVENDPNLWTYVWENLPITEWSGENAESIEYLYEVEELQILRDGIDVTSAFTKEYAEDDRLTITNTYEGQELKISKLWQPEPEENWSVTANIKVRERKYSHEGTVIAESSRGEWSEWADFVEEGSNTPKTVTLAKTNDTYSAGVTFDNATKKHSITVALPLYRYDTENNDVYELQFTAEEDTTELPPGYTLMETTDENGEVTFRNENTEVVVEVEKAWDPTPTDEDNASVTVELRRYAIIQKGTINVTLKSDLGGAIEGATFELYKDDVATGQTYTTDASGKISVTGLEKGTYYLKQTTTPADYRIDGEVKTDTLTVVDGSTVKQELNSDLTNTALVIAGQVTLTLKNEAGDTTLAGGTFDLYKDGVVIVTGLVTDENGQWTKDSLEAGHYHFIQTGAPEGYKVAEGIIGAFVISGDDQFKGEIQVRNVEVNDQLIAKGSVTLTLKNKAGTALAGGVFTLKLGDEVVQSGLTTDANGQVTMSDLGAGTYTFVQTNAPAGYSVAANSTFTVEDNGRIDNSYTVNVQNSLIPINVVVKRVCGGNLVDTVEKSYEPGTTFMITINAPGKNQQDGLGFAIYVNNVDTGQTLIEGQYEKVDHTYSFTLPDTAPETGNYVIEFRYNNWGSDTVTIKSFNPDPDKANNVSGGLANTAGIFTLSRKAPVDTQVRLLGANPTVTHTDATPTVPAGYANDSSFEAISYELKSDDDWKHTFDPQPKYDEDGNPYYYYVVETAHTPADYWIDSYSGDPLNESGKITITNKAETKGDITVTKTLKHNGEVVTGNTDTFYVGLFTRSGSEGNYTYTRVTGTTNKPVTTSTSATFDNLDFGTYYVFEMNGDTDTRVEGTYGVYTVTGSGTEKTLSSSNLSASVEIINDKEDGALVITKNVKFNGNDATTNEQKALLNKTFQFAVKKDGTPITGSPFDITVTDGKSNSITIDGLAEGDYTIEETNSNGLTLTSATGGKAVASSKVVTVHVTKGKTTKETVTSDAKAEFTNNLPTTDITVNKTWLVGSTDYSGSLTDLFGEGITVGVEVVKVAADADAEAISAAQVVKDVFGTSATGTITASDGWTTTISDLPELGANEVYAVRESDVSLGDGATKISLKDCFTITGEGIVANDGSITINNVPETVDVTVEKKWKPVAGESATLALYKGKDAASATTKVTDITLDGTADDVAANIGANDATAGTKQEDSAWHAKFASLPKYGVLDGAVSQIAYVIKEDTVPEGYSVTYDGAAAGTEYVLTGGSITNTKNPGDLSLTKRLAGDGDPEKVFAFTVTLTFPEAATEAITYNTKINSEASEAVTVAAETTTIEVTVNLKKDQTWTIEDLPAGTAYSIEEADYTADGYTSDAMTTPVTGTVAGGTSAAVAVEVENTYTPGGLTVSKTTAGNGAKDSDEFEFQVTFEKEVADGDHGTYKVAEGDESPVTFASGESIITFTLKNGESAVFSNLPKDTEWTVKENSADQNGYITTLTSSGTVQADKTATGTITAAASNAAFTNTKEIVDIDAEKVWKNGTAYITDTILNASVTFELQESTDGENWTKVTPTTAGEENPQTISNTDEARETWKASWTNLPKYKLVTGNDSAVTQELIQYKVVETAATLNNDSVLAANTTPEVVIVDDDNDYKEAKAPHENPYAAETLENELPTTELEGKKVWNIIGEMPETDPTLTLSRISKKDGAEAEDVEPADGQPVWEEVPGEKSKTFKYSELPLYDSEGYEYEYSVTEASFEIDGVTYTVTKDEENDTYIVEPDEDHADSAVPFAVTIETSEEDGTTITNTEEKDFEFKKIWMSADGTGAETWQKEITVTLYRKAGNDGDEESVSVLTIDKDEVSKKVTASGDPEVSITVVEPAAGSEEDGYTFKITGLDAYNNERTEYVYYVKESEVEDYTTSYAGADGNRIVDGTEAYDGGQIINTPFNAVELPHTGGHGTLPFKVSGSILLAFSALMYVTSFRRRREEALARTGGYFEGDAEREAVRGGGSRR